MLDPKKEMESGFLKVFRRLCEDFPAGEIELDETPDFVIHGKHARLGIEITRLFLDDGKNKRSQQGIEAARDRIVSKAIELASAVNVPYAHVTFFFNWTVQIRRSRELSIAQALIRAVQEGMPVAGEHTTLSYKIGGVQPLEVDEILVHRGLPAGKHDWQWLEAGHIQENAIDIITRAIEQKAALVERILHKCDSCWLLLVADPFRSSGKIRPNRLSLSYEYRSAFERTYFLDVGLVTLSLLQTAYSEAAPLG